MQTLDNIAPMVCGWVFGTAAAAVVVVWLVYRIVAAFVRRLH